VGGPYCIFTGRKIPHRRDIPTREKELGEKDDRDKLNAECPCKKKKIIWLVTEIEI
jgi:hypothetical protein